MSVATESRVAEAYAALAAAYDTFTDAYRHEVWLQELVNRAHQHGLRRRDVLDVACGTGKSLAPLIGLGFTGSGCDVSPQMLEIAARRLPGVRLHRADMRALPALGRFPWITCLNDAINYLLTADDLHAALTSMGRLLEPGGLLAFDINTLREHREGFSATWVVEGGDHYVCWRGRGWREEAGLPGHADVDVFTEHDGIWTRAHSRHEQRWWSDREIADTATRAGLEIAGRYGQLKGAILRAEVDEQACHKVVYFLRRPPDAEGGVA